MGPPSSNGNHPPVNGNGSRAGGGLPPPPSSGAEATEADAAPGCWQLPGLLLRLAFWLGMLVVILWLLVVFLTSVG